MTLRYLSGFPRISLYLCISWTLTGGVVQASSTQTERIRQLTSSKAIQLINKKVNKSTQEDLPLIEVKAWPSSPYQLPTVQIGTRLGEKWLDTAQSVSALNAAQMDDRQMNSDVEAITSMTGVRGKFNKEHSVAYIIRGQSANITYDGVPGFTRQIGFDNFDPAIYESITVIRGSDGRLGGAGEMGGTINFQKKQPKEHSFFNTKLTVGSWKQFGQGVDWNHNFGKVSTRLVLDHYEQNYFYDHAYMNRWLGMFSVQYKPTEATKLNLSYSWQRRYSKGYSNGFGLLAKNSDQIWAYADLPITINFSAPWVHSETNLRELAGFLQHSFDNNAVVKFSLNYRQRNDQYREVYQSNTFTPGNPLRTNFSFSRGSGEENRLGLALDTRLPFHLFNQTHELLLGGSFDTYTYTSRRYQSLSPVLKNVPINELSVLNQEPLWKDPTYEGQVRGRELVLYSQLKLNITPKLQFNAGIKTTKVLYQDRGIDLATHQKEPWSDTKDTNYFHPTPYLNIIYKLTPTLSIYGSYAGIFMPFPTNFRKMNDQILDPREGRQIELGIKKSFNHGKFDVSLAFFDLREKNRAFDLDTRNANGNWAYINLGETSDRGVELEVNGSPIEGLELSGGYTILKTIVTKDPLTKGYPQDFRAPKHVFKLYGQYTIPTAYRLSGLTLGAGIYAQSGTPDERNLRPLILNSGFAIFDIYAKYPIGKNFLLSMKLGNLFNRKYIKNVGGTSFNNFYGNPRNILFTLSGKF